jgi:chemosensory pili system protein ChpA (sensor histidine kinase/response regulator)
MDKFKISDIQAVIAADFQKFRDETRGHLGLLIAQSPHSQESLAEVIRYAHTLKGLAATVEAWGLSNWGADLEKLFELAGTYFHSAHDKAEEIFRFVMKNMEAWSVMNAFSLAEQFEPAWDYYQGLRAMMEQRWPGYLEPVVTSLAKETPPVAAPEPAPAPVVAAAPPVPVNLAPPPLQRRATEAAASSESVAATPSEALAAPTPPAPLTLQPPTLRRAADKSRPDAAASVEASSVTDPSAALEPSAVAPEAPATPPPILRVLPPTLRRKTRRAAEPMAAAMPQEITAAASNDLAAGVRPSPGAETSELSNAPAYPHALEPTPMAAPEDGRTPAESAAPSGDFAPAADAEMLEMLGQEISGYLTELAEKLKSLPARLADQELWETTRRLFHTIKGTAATFHLDAVSAPAKAAEARCIVAIEDAQARTFDTFEACLERAAAVAAALHVAFPRDEIALAQAEAKAASAASAQAEAETPLDTEMAGFFVRDARDQIETIEQAVLRWEKGEHPLEQVWAAQRGFHTLKGAANSIGLTRVAKSVHDAEGFLEGVAIGGGQGSPALFSFLLGAVDQLRAYTKELSESPATRWPHDWAEALRAFGPAPARHENEPAIEDAPTAAVVQPQIPGSDSTEEESHTLRIDASRLHKLMNLIGEVVIDRSRLEKKIELLNNLHRELVERNAALTAQVQSFQQQFEFNLLQDRGATSQPKAPGDLRAVTPATPGRSESEFSELEFDRYDQFSILARSLIEISHDVEEVSDEMSQCLDSFSIENTRFRETSRHLQDSVTSLSLLPVSTLFPRLQRAFRDAVQVEHKEADLELEGGAALLDKVVIDKIFAPLMHLLRNAVAHGIEETALREQLKKPARGQVKINTTQLSNQIVIQITDDGSGVRAEAVRQRAIEKGWLSTDAPALTHDQVVHFIFQPGFSTASKLTSVSGRGVGLDVVRREIEGLNGSVELHYEPGAGSTWTLRLPLTLSISEAILADSGGVTFAFPINFIESGLIIETSALQQEDGRNTCAVGEARLPVANLSELLALPGQSDASNGLIISAGDRRAIVAVDRVLRRQEIVVKQLDSIFARHPLLNGATLDADGKVIPILNLPTLLKFSEGAASRRTQQSRRVESAEDHRQLRVLIADDSLSVRKVQERLLADLGCHVTAASDGLHALEKLREGKFDFIFTDLEMPRLNGYELISEVRGHPAWASLPVVVISSRGADKYITKAMNLGATSFLSKPFTQEQLGQVLHFYGGWNAKNRVRTTPGVALQEAV